ncbi:MAG: hypothetical protein O3B31_12260, partial [Chloroflexi bacterium]|nr:hypothetical protein [Chloroflexota bacterium]
AGAPDRAPRLDVYVASDCVGCAAARAVTARARLAYPRVTVAVVDLDVSSIRPPPGVIAVPTFVLNDRVISLGTPSWEQIAAQLEAAITEERS